MKRDYSSGVSESATFYTGIEIEHTPALGMKTLFVVGLQDSQEVIDYATEHNCENIYFGANASFKPNGVNDSEYWTPWEEMITDCLGAGFWCTLDLDVKDIEGLVEGGLIEQYKFIPMISVKVPYIHLLGYNATLKIDDIDFKATNAGVWCHSIHTLQDRKVFTDWSQYTKDEIIK